MQTVYITVKVIMTNEADPQDVAAEMSYSMDHEDIISTEITEIETNNKEKNMSQQIHKDFTEELKALLKKYNAEISLEDVGRNYNSEYQIVTEFHTPSEDGSSDYSELVIGSYIDKD